MSLPSSWWVPAVGVCSKIGLDRVARLTLRKGIVARRGKEARAGSCSGLFLWPHDAHGFPLADGHSRKEVTS